MGCSAGYRAAIVVLSRFAGTDYFGHVKNLLLVAIVGSLCAVACSEKSPSGPSQGGPTPTPTPTLPPGPPLSGFVRDSLTDAPLVNARVEIVDTTTGTLSGNFVVTDASGKYSFLGISGSQSFRASKEGYEGEPRRIHLVTTSTATFFLMPVSAKPPRESMVPGETKNGTVVSADSTCGGMFFILPCKRFILTVSESATLRVRLTWPSGDDIDLELWKDDTLFAKSLNCQACGFPSSEEEFTRFVPAGEYELRATLYFGAGGPFTLTVTRID